MPRTPSAARGTGDPRPVSVRDAAAAPQGAGTLRFDAVAGLITAAVVIPKAMAYATIAGLPVQVGLYTALVTPTTFVTPAAFVTAAVSVASVATFRRIGRGGHGGQCGRGGQRGVK